MNECMLRQRQPRVEIMQNGHLVSRCSDYIIYSVEAKNIDAVVKAFGPCMLILLLLTVPTTDTSAYSYQGWRYSWRTDIMQSPRNGCL
jgi:hypothetical protein